MGRTKDLLIGVGLSTRGLNRDLGKMRRGFNRSFGEIKAAGRKMTMAISAPLVALGAKATKVFVGFEHSMAKVRAVSGATNTEFAKLESSAKALGRTTIFTAAQVAELQLVLAKMGVSADEIVKVEQSILQLAQATDSDLAQAADVVSSTLRAFGKDMSHGRHLSDVMAASFSNTALSMDSFSNSMTYVAPVAKAAGVSIEQATAMLGILANNGIRGSKAGRALRRILTDLGSTGKPVGEAIADLAAKGLDLEQSMDEVGRSAQTQLLILANNVEQLEPMAQGYANADGAAAKMAETMDNTTFGAFKRMSSAIEGVQLSIGKALAPMLERLSVIVANAMAMFTSLSPSMQRMAVIGAMIAAAIGPLMVILPTLISAFGMVAGVISGPVLLAIAGVVAAVALMIHNWDAIVEYFTEGDGAKMWSALVDSIVVATQAILDLWESFVNWLIKIWDDYGDMFMRALTRLWDDTADIFVRVFNALGDLLQGFAAAFRGDWQQMFERLYNICIESVAVIVRAVGWMVTEILNLVDLGLRAMGAESDLGGAFEKTIDDAVGYLDTLKFEFDETTDEATKFFNGIGSGFGKLFERSGGIKTDRSADTTTENGDEVTPENLMPAGLMTPMEIPPPNTNQWSSWANGFRDMVGNLTTFVDELRNASVQMGQALGGAFVAAASGAENAKDQMKSALGGIIDTAFAAATAHIIQANAAAAIGSGLAAPVVAPILIAAGMAVVRGAFGAVTGFADGGIVSGPTMGLVAEYPGARTNPEVIAPLDKLQSMIGGQTTNVVGTIKGRDLVLANQRGGYSRRRAFG